MSEQHDPIEVVRGDKIAIHFEGRRCIHSRHCVLSRPDVFVPNVDGEWIHPDAATPEAVAELAHRCPSGAIRYQRLDGGPEEQAPIVNTLRLRQNGPYTLHAEIEIDGEPAPFRATLCRCGASKRKPYCDQSHVALGFDASGEPATIPSEPLALRSGKVRVRPKKDGPLVLDGPLEVVSGTGRTIKRVPKAFFCRCGHSSTKPFCDSTHKKVGFTADGE